AARRRPGLYHGAQHPAHPRGQGSRGPPRGRQGVSLLREGGAGGRRQERPVAAPRQDLRRIRRAAADPDGERSRPVPRGAQAPARPARRAAGQEPRRPAMIAAWMGYCLLITATLALVGWLLERIATVQRRPRRWVWTGVLLASAVLVAVS